MKNIFELAQFYAERNYSISPQQALKLAVDRTLEGYMDLEDAALEDSARIDPYGNEISPAIVHDAIIYRKWEAADILPH